MLKRLIFAMFVMLIENHKVLQTMLILHLLLIGGVYTLSARAFEDPITNLQESINDLLCFVIAYCLLFFGDFVDDPKTKYTMGWLVVGFIALNIFINLAFIVGVSLSQLKRRWKYYYRDFKSRILRCLIRFRNKEDTSPEPQNNSSLFIKRKNTLSKSVEYGDEKLEVCDYDLELQQNGGNSNSQLRHFSTFGAKTAKVLDVIHEESKS